MSKIPIDSGFFNGQVVHRAFNFALPECTEGVTEHGLRRMAQVKNRILGRLPYRINIGDLRHHAAGVSCGSQHLRFIYHLVRGTVVRSIKN